MDLFALYDVLTNEANNSNCKHFQKLIKQILITNKIGCSYLHKINNMFVCTNCILDDICYNCKKNTSFNCPKSHKGIYSLIVNTPVDDWLMGRDVPNIYLHKTIQKNT